MPLPRLPCVGVALGALLVTAAPSAAQVAAVAQVDSDALFHGYLTGPVAVAAFLPLESTAREEAASDEDAAGPGWLTASRGYLAGGAAAIAAGIALSSRSGSDAATVAVTDPVGVTGTALSAPAAAPPGVLAPNVIVNPEPGTVLLMGTGLGALLLMARRRRKG